MIVYQDLQRDFAVRHGRGDPRGGHAEKRHAEQNQLDARHAAPLDSPHSTRDKPRDAHRPLLKLLQGNALHQANGRYVEKRRDLGEIIRENRLERVFFPFSTLHQKQHEVLHFPQFPRQNRGISLHLVEVGLLGGLKVDGGESEFPRGILHGGIVGVHLVGEEDKAELSEHCGALGCGLVESGWEGAKGSYEGSTVTAMSQSEEAASWAKRSACCGDMPTPVMSMDLTVSTSSR